MAKKGAPEGLEGQCRIAEIMQYSCVPKNATVHCVPIPRLFRICPGRPAVEVTRVLNVDLTTGYVEMPRHLEQKLPEGKAWADVIRYDTSSEDP
ncbi:hypothetical protein B0H14DRAFT_2933778 [Mycena olivaceomarginata]|uniref:Uncharacterized protein n=1 Tax=Mycena albidolilacea TaxID=1033008 RepID=A0AAD7EL78_9AGAR|nr:hypothetical protein DFH08DRAFT_878803 [Mycena albidolilacea]KAJ7791954.1 hypothetical protein B0H14DRAFT_2933778 [Mycena olivaceomarginata]